TLFTPGALQNAARQVGFRAARLLKPPFQAELWFRPSAAIRRGEDPIDNPNMPAGVLRQARQADRIAWLRPSLAEEILLLAQKGQE
ncbi:MAG TPA: hypothetical protein VKT32_03980, partial [Chthonomonadaceae bacterium]|nr:hypothetical protein [Chthonomonadaceae bacterium]